ncbi:MAG: hypothetical protein IT461_05865 [Planctomycetes bacterium]|jgi:hypothetical protein|nr:hypothetical protein [Planctomycetota bacterium]
MRLIATLMLCLIAAPLWAQPPAEEPPKEPPKDPPKEQPLPPPDEPLPEPGMDPAEFDERIREAIERRLEEIQPLRSRKQLFVEFGGGLCVKYRQAQKNDLNGIPDGGFRAPVGFGIDRAWLGVYAGYSDLVEATVELRFNGNYSLLDEELFEFQRAFIVYNQPLSQFNVFGQGIFNDNVLFGLDGRFYRQARESETMALGQRAFTQDEVIQARYTARFARSFYAIAALSDGNLLGKAHVDDSQNYPLLADDRTRYWRGLGDANEINRYIQFEFGGGFIFDFNTTSFLNSPAPFSPERATAQNTNYVNVLLWGSIDRLSRNELLLVEGLQRVPFKGGTVSNPGGRIRRAKWRVGANADFSIRIGDGDLVVAGHFIHAEDGRLVRNAWGVEARYTFVLPRIPFFLRITPMVRISELTTNNSDNPLDVNNPYAHPGRISNGAVPGFSLADGAGFAADRHELMLGVNLTLARNVTLGFEVIFNEEDFHQTRSIASDVPNMLYMLRLIAEF